MSIVIAVDGTAASGKGTLAKKLARAFRLRPSGFRRALSPGGARRCWKPAAIPTNEADAVQRRADHRSQLAPAIPPSAPTLSARRPRRSPPSRPCARRCSISSGLSWPIRRGGSLGAVMDGRDIGTVICPDADRQALRRCRARSPAPAAAGWNSRPSGIRPGRGGFAGRNQRPRRAPTASRAVSPLKQAPDAGLLDTSIWV